MVEVYAKLVSEGLRTLENVPKKYRLEVEKIVNERNEAEQSNISKIRMR